MTLIGTSISIPPARILTTIHREHLVGTAAVDKVNVQNLPFNETIGTGISLCTGLPKLCFCFCEALQGIKITGLAFICLAFVSTLYLTHILRCLRKFLVFCHVGF